MAGKLLENYPAFLAKKLDELWLTEKLEKALRKTREPVEYRPLVERIFAQCPLRARGAEPAW